MILMIMNYNKWFFNQHQYLKNTRDGNQGFNDTKWVNINKRYKTLVDMESSLLIEQPLLIHGNNTGFDKLIDLLGRSNYTFEDLDESMKDTYRVSLQNAMSRNLVNTHAVMFHCNNMTKSNVTSENFTHYRIIDAPFNQLHFGHRDEFIRQKLHEMHNTESGYYIDISRFNSLPISEILGFSIICTVNGYFCNDCKVAVDDKGFKFKVGWPYASDVDFIVYKLDHSKMYQSEVSVNNISNNTVIPYSVLGIPNVTIGTKCILNIYDKRFTKTSPSVPNFGIFEADGLKVVNLQQTTVDAMNNFRSETMSIDIYALKYFHEIPNLYPAINYYDIMDSRVVYDERYENIKTPKGNRVVSSSNNRNSLEVCTPPITLDRDVSYSFDIIQTCLTMYDTLMSYNNLMFDVGQLLLNGTYADFVQNYKQRLKNMYGAILALYNKYQQGAIITSLVSTEQIDLFGSLVSKVKKLSELSDWSKAQSYAFDELYESNYRTTVTAITEPFHNTALSAFSDIGSVSKNFFTDDNSTRFNRPVVEQCFITLRYHHNDKCWLFDYPEIKHFKGIGNTFYIDSDLNGTELFKFFVLYSDTEAPTTKNIDHFDINTIFDFDQFSKEVDKHLGCIRYWDAECRLMKLSKMLYNKYDDETCVQVMSKILKRKLEGDSLLKVYPSDINYEESNANSDNWESYDENTERGPFAINFLFYTLSMLNNNEDKLQSYFYRHLTNQKFNNRYSDIDIRSILDNERYPVSYSQFTISPSRLSDDCNKPTSVAYSFYGLPLILNSGGNNLYEPYRYVLNVYDPEIAYPSISENDINSEYYVKYSDITDYAGKVVSYHDNIQAGRLLTLYLSAVYDYISDIQTNYSTSYNILSTIESAITTINEHIRTIQGFVDNANIVDIDGLSDVNDVLGSVINNNNFINRLNRIKTLVTRINNITYNGLNKSIIEFVNSRILGTLKQVYVTTGFDNNAAKRARMLYIHLKKINTPMNPYQYKKWLNGIDMHILKNLDKMLADNENYNLGNDVFLRLHDTLAPYISSSLTDLDSMIDEINDLSIGFQTEHINPITTVCDDVINKTIFDMFTIADVTYDPSLQYSSKPSFVVIEVPSSKHTHPPIGTSITTTTNLVLQPIIDKVGNSYVIRSLSNICEYVFFDGESISGLQMSILDISGRVIGTQQVVLTFDRIGSTADRVNVFKQLPNMRTTSIDFENGHESFDVVNGLIVNEKHADMNYEMLIGNHFIQLDHDIEYVLEPDTWLQGSIDRLYIDNQMINKMSSKEFGHKVCSNVFFKPSQVIHIPLNEDGSIDSVDGKYFEGETIYLKTVDGLTTFPVVITSIDHAINKGFVEAKVDGWNSSWFEITDPETITKYLTTNIECVTVDDNVRNFLDEFSDGSLPTYSNPGYNSTNVVYDDNIDTCYKLPGDPIFVSSNANFVYNRLNWFFNELVPNRFIDEDHKTHRFIYLTNGFIMNGEDELKINMINHDFNNTSIPERYPILRDEPNDHSVWQQEISTFNQEQYIAHQSELALGRERAQAERAVAEAKTKYEKERCIENLEAINRKIKRLQDYIDRLELYKRQLETPTTWFNVISHEASLVYISNGRADKFSPHFVSNIRDAVYADDMEVFLYDWEHKQWLDPSTYEINTEMVDRVRIDERDDYSTNRVLYTITIKPKEEFIYSKKILVYLSYEKSNVFDDIDMNPSTCMVRFKPVLSLDSEITDYDPYSNIKIRKHFDGYEKYKVESGDDGIYVKRVKRSSKYVYAPTFRVCDIKISDGNGDHTYEDIDKFMIPAPFKHLTTQRVFNTPSYSTQIHSPIDSFEPNKEVKLICISNNELSSYDGNISSVMFNAITALDGNNEQQLVVTKSTLPNYVEGSFICTVFQDDRYDPVGGVITVNVTLNTESIYDEWVTVPIDYMKYREVPNEFKLVMKNQTSGDVIVTLENHYVKSIDDTIGIDNANTNNPYEYYYDQTNLTRLPISDVRVNTNSQRLVIDKTKNPNVSIIKAPYIGICRYSLNRIPKNGFIDLTGYLPTPLTRDRYEFWVNGRCIKNNKDLIILSPTSIQLCNLQSLKNFEVIELVDDINTDNDLMKEGTVYVDLNGNSYSNYRLALLSNSRIRNQDIMFTFNTNVHRQIHDYSKDIISKTNNRDVETDILDYITFDDDVLDYNKLYNIPSINGVSIFHPKIQGLGISEIPNDNIIEMFDKVWKLEETTNPLFVTTHRDNRTNTDEKILTLHIKQITEPHWNGLTIDTTGMFLIYATGPVEKYFSYYISKTSDGVIDDVNNTVKIIPFIMPGVYVLIDKKYQGMWLHATHGKTKPIHIVNMTPEK